MFQNKEFQKTQATVVIVVIITTIIDDGDGGDDHDNVLYIQRSENNF